MPNVSTRIGLLDALPNATPLPNENVGEIALVKDGNHRAAPARVSGGTQPSLTSGIPQRG